MSAARPGVGERLQRPASRPTLPDVGVHSALLRPATMPTGQWVTSSRAGDFVVPAPTASMLRSMILSPTPPLMRGNERAPLEPIRDHFRLPPMGFGRVVCVQGYWTCLRSTNAGEAATARTRSVNDCVLLRLHLVATSAAAQPAGAWRAAAARPRRVGHRVLEHRLRHAVREHGALRQLLRELDGAVHGLRRRRRPAAGGARRSACPGGRSSGSGRRRRTSPAPGRRDRTTAWHALHGQSPPGTPPAPAPSCVSSIAACAVDRTALHVESAAAGVSRHRNSAFTARPRGTTPTPFARGRAP